MKPNWIAVGALLAAVFVGLGAFGAHGLEGRVERGELDPERLETWNTAVFYGALHALALVQIGLFGRERGGRGGAAAWLLLAGVLLFSGSLHAWVLGGPKFLVYVTPVGGTLFIAGWLALAWTVRGGGSESEANAG